ncbi:MAG: hypothetical protein EBU90_12930 [Proteobacteria bacterium]|nr:hypothetical protein [Pseudomonadota bacterium]NBP15870.1 hypothetical protein [bacterium]
MQIELVIMGSANPILLLLVHLPLHLIAVVVLLILVGIPMNPLLLVQQGIQNNAHYALVIALIELAVDVYIHHRPPPLCQPWIVAIFAKAVVYHITANLEGVETLRDLAPLTM